MLRTTRSVRIHLYVEYVDVYQGLFKYLNLLLYNLLTDTSISVVLLLSYLAMIYGVLSKSSENVGNSLRLEPWIEQKRNETINTLSLHYLS